MRILGFDTTAKYLSVAIAEDEKILVSVHEEVGIKHSALLLPKIKELLKSQNLRIRDIDVIAISIGPGSFTGLRIGVAIAKALALSVGMKIVSVPTMDVIASNYADKGDKLVPLLDARKNMIYFCVYDKQGDTLVPKTDYVLSDITDLESRIKDDKFVVFGDGLKLYGSLLKDKFPNLELIDDDNWYPKAETVVKLGYHKAIEGKFEDAEKLVPLYLHPNDCHIRKS